MSQCVREQYIQVRISKTSSTEIYVHKILREKKIHILRIYYYKETIIILLCTRAIKSKRAVEESVLF